MNQDVMSKIQQMAVHPGEAFNTVLIAGLIATVAIIVVHALLTALFGRRAQQQHSPWTWWERLLYLAMLISVAVLAFTSFYTVRLYGKTEGWWLMAHMNGAGLFVAVLPLLALTWYNANRVHSGTNRFFWLPKAMFWLMLIGGLVVILTMLLSMLPMFGTEGLEQLLVIHRYAGLLVVSATVIHLYAVILQRLHWR
jgi:hypothetical protein